MDVSNVKKYIGKKVLIILRNNFKYTCIIPEFSNDSFTIIDKFDKKIEINCEFISLISESEK